MPNASSDNAAAAKKLTRNDLPETLQRALDVAIDKSARAPVILEVTEITGYTDWVLIVSGRSERHVAAISDGIKGELRAKGCKAQGADGMGEHNWDLLDYDDFMVHVFYHPVRMHYDLESMWSDAARVELDLSAEVTDTSDLDELDAPHSMPAYRGDLVFGGFEDEFEDDDDFGDEDFVPSDDDDDFEPAPTPVRDTAPEPTPDNDEPTP